MMHVSCRKNTKSSKFFSAQNTKFSEFLIFTPNPPKPSHDNRGWSPCSSQHINNRNDSRDGKRYQEKLESVAERIPDPIVKQFEFRLYPKPAWRHFLPPCRPTYNKPKHGQNRSDNEFISFKPIAEKH